ncbi:MAG: diguanylate cyclase [Oxalobacter sp.]|nr:MAG: diguanylate cyclase [Oxalobacter sp.]
MVFSKRFRLALARLNRGEASSRPFNRILPWLVLTIALGVTGLLWRNAQKQIENELQTEFNFSVQEVSRDIELRMETYKLLLHGLQGLFASSNAVSRKEFHTYVETLDLKTRYPGIQRLGFSVIVPKNKRASHIATLRAQGFPKYAITPNAGAPLVTANVYVDPPSERNRRALGYDMYTNPLLREAMIRAQEQGKPAVSAKLLPQPSAEASASPEFVMFLPIYANPPPDKKEAEKRPLSVIGWVYTQFRADELMTILSAGQKEKIELAIYDGEIADDDGIIADESSRLSGTRAETPSFQRTSQLHAVRHLAIAGRTWTLTAHSLPKLEKRFDHSKPIIILISGIGISLLLALQMQMLIHGHAHAVEIANEMNRELIQSEYRWKYALEGAGEGVWDWNISSGYMYKSRRLKEEFLGYAEGEYADTFDAWEKNLHPDDRPAVMETLHNYLEGKTKEFVVEQRLHCKDGSWKWILMRGMVVSRDPSGKPLRMIGTHADISERYKKDASLRLSSAVLETMNEAVLITDAHSHILSVNPSFTKITGFLPEDVIGQDTMVLSTSLEMSEKILMIRDVLDKTGSYTGEVTHRRKTGELYIAWLSISTVRNSTGEVVNRVVVFSDISERKANEERMQYLAHFDPLTDLPNRALFSDRLRQALAICRRSQSRLAVLFVDLDKFKPVNDTLGHAIGDLLLREVAYRLLDNIRESDSAARIGGDEFVVMLSGIETEGDAIVVAEKILSSVCEPYLLDNHTIQIAASIGIALYPNHGHSDQELLSHADEAMYHAKHRGGAAVATYSQVISAKPSAD